MRTISAKNENIYIIDAGHGGEDGGAVAFDGTVEKDLNLDTARNLNNIMRLFGFKTVMTRETDASVGDNTLPTIRERKTSDIKSRSALLSNTEKGILVSIHQNMFTIEKYSGTQIFYSEKTPESKLLAEKIRENVVKQLQTDNYRKCKPSGENIYILYHAERPAVMVECGFLSNRAELEKLKSGEYRIQLAFAIFCGIYEFDYVMI